MCLSSSSPFLGIVPQNPDLSYAIVDVFFGVAIFEIILSIFLIIFFVYHFNHRVIRQSAPLTTLAMLFGVLGMAISLLITSFGKTDAICTIILYTFRISFYVVLAGLSLKNFRIYKIFSNKSANALNITEYRLLTYLGLSALLYTVYITIFVAVFGYDAVLKQSSKDLFYQYIRCAIPNKFWEIFFQITIELLFVILILVSLCLSWLTRKVTSQYSESHALAAFSITITASFIIFVPLNFTLSDDVDSQILKYTVMAEFITIASFSAFGFLFFPKVYGVIKNKREYSIVSSRIDDGSIMIEGFNQNNNL